MLQALPYYPDSTHLFAQIANQPWSVYLDSGRPDSGHGRYDVIAADPVATIVSRNGISLISTSTGTSESTCHPFDLIRSTLGENQDSSLLPFVGGAIGYAAYGVANYLPYLPTISLDPIGMPDMCFGIYDWAVVVDHKEQKSWLARSSRFDLGENRWNELIEIFSKQKYKHSSTPFGITGSIKSNLTIKEYADAFERIKSYIHEGDCYQVNLAQKFSVSCKGDPWQAYMNLRTINPSPFSAYINTPYGQILSSSPERFLRVDDRDVETRPIKGTRPRSQLPDEDARLLYELQNSEKDRAENLMIVDLLRNDLGRSCIPGSIDATDLFKVESFPKVHHLVSTVTGQLSKESDALSLLSGCFPGGSITGAPKYRAMEIIDELEHDPRGIYCGTIGYIGYDGNMDSNIAIRTMIHTDGEIHFSAGGGIVSDSDMESEYQETLDKASAMFEMLGDSSLNLK